MAQRQETLPQGEHHQEGVTIVHPFSHLQGAGAPKQPLSGYVHFLNERRESVRGENPDITFSELSKKLAAEWSALPEEEKLKYNEFAKKDKDR